MESSFKGRQTSEFHVHGVVKGTPVAESRTIGRRLAFLAIIAALVGGGVWIVWAIAQYRPVCYPAYVRLIYSLDADTHGKGKQVVAALRRCLWHEPPDCQVRMRRSGTVEVCLGTDPRKWDTLLRQLSSMGLRLTSIMAEMADIMEAADHRAASDPATQADDSRAQSLADKSDAMTREISRRLVASRLRGVDDVRAIIERGSGMAFCVLAERSSVGDQASILLSRLETDGPQAAGAYVWYELADLELMDQTDVVVGQFKGRPYVLACAAAELTMVQDRAGASWSVREASVGLGFDERLVVNFVLDPAGGSQLEALSARAYERRLAIVVGGRVYAAPMVRGTLGASGQISGHLNYSDCVRLAGYLLAPPEPLGLQSGPMREPMVKKPLWVWREIPAHAAGGPVLVLGAAVAWFGLRRRASRAGIGSSGCDSCPGIPGGQADTTGTRDITVG